MGKLTDKAIQATQPNDKQYSLSDGGGLVLIVRPNGARLWWLRYRFAGKSKTLSIGQYPVVSLKDARERAFEARKLLQNGVDPSASKQEAKAALIQAAILSEDTVEKIAREWFDKFSVQWVESHADKIIKRLERDLFPYLGKAEIASVKPADLLAVLRKVEARGTLETAHRLLQNCGQIWRYAVATGRVERGITEDLKGAIPPSRSKHLGAVVKPEEVGALLRSIDEYKGGEIVRHALKLAPLFFVRPGELRHAEWEEMDIDKAEWVIPAQKMKMKREHVVPLSRQALEIIESLRKITGTGKYLFPSATSKSRPISDMALLTAIRRMGYSKDEMTAHGFRALASTNLEHLGYDVRIIELQLAHADPNEIRAAYKRDTSRLQMEQRRKMMQAWADHLDQLKTGAKILEFRTKER